MTEHAEGLVSVIWPEVHGVVVTADVDAADTALTVRNASDLVNYPGGLLQLPDGSAVAIDGYTFGATGDTVSLAAAVGTDYTAELELPLVEYDADGDLVPVTTYWMTVLSSDGSVNDAIIPPHKVPTLADGIRDADRQERVAVTRESDGEPWVFDRVLRRPPRLDLSTARPGTLPGTAIADGPIAAHVSLPNMTTVPPVVTAAIAAFGPGGSEDGGAFLLDIEIDEMTGSITFEESM